MCSVCTIFPSSVAHCLAFVQHVEEKYFVLAFPDAKSLVSFFFLSASTRGAQKKARDEAVLPISRPVFLQPVSKAVNCFVSQYNDLRARAKLFLLWKCQCIDETVVHIVNNIWSRFHLYFISFRLRTAAAVAAATNTPLSALWRPLRREAPTPHPPAHSDSRPARRRRFRARHPRRGHRIIRSSRKQQVRGGWKRN